MRTTFVKFYGRATARQRGLPGFFVIGAQKAGASSLCRYLANHPELAPGLVAREINYFDNRYHKSMLWYRSNFPKKTNQRIFFEASTNYIFHPLCPERIHRAFPQAFLIALLRNPVERAYFHYLHQLKNGEETLSFEEAIEQEPIRLEGEEERIIGEPGYQSYHHRNFSYLARGDYLSQIKRWHGYFPRERLSIHSSEDFFADPQGVLDQIFSFLGVSPCRVDKGKKHNAGNYTSRIEPETRKRLVSHFKPLNEALFDYLNQNFNWQ